MKVYISNRKSYDLDSIYSFLPDDIFEPVIEAKCVVLKPNWVSESHKSKIDQWEHVITHPTIITAVIKKIIKIGKRLQYIIVTDGPQTDSSFSKILALNPIEEWHRMAFSKGIKLDVIDLRDHEWVSEKGVIIERKKLRGDPAGKSLFNLKERSSEFFGQVRSKRGYYGADYNLSEVNNAHDGLQNLYSVSRSVIQADVFIILPKLKTHKKAGITCCLKNLVGINTFKNYLPHHMEGDPTESGDQYPIRNKNSIIEGPMLALLKKKMLINSSLTKVFSPLKTYGEFFFGSTRNTIRSGNWYGNDTLWRTIIDLNKILLYGNPDGSFREPSQNKMKQYIAVVDGILAGQGNGPLEPDPVNFGRLICGSNAVAVDVVCAHLMGFDPLMIPSIRNSFSVKSYPLTHFNMNDIIIENNGIEYFITEIPENLTHRFKPHFGWVKHIEK